MEQIKSSGASAGRNNTGACIVAGCGGDEELLLLRSMTWYVLKLLSKSLEYKINCKDKAENPDILPGVPGRCIHLDVSKETQRWYSFY